MFPFTYKNVKYTGCTLEDADDGKPWCSTKTDANGEHVGSKGQWGHCASTCKTTSTSRTTTRRTTSIRTTTRRTPNCEYLHLIIVKVLALVLSNLVLNLVTN